MAGMTERKPADMPVATWVEQQIRAAEAGGAFTNLPGRGPPLPDLGRPRSDLDWIAAKLRREDVDVSALLPPALALAREVERLPGRLAEERSESGVRRVVEDLNARIRSAILVAPPGPPVRVRPLDVEEQVMRWRAGRAPAPPQPGMAHRQSAPRPARWRWLRRLRSR
jgi:hypothetical protein